MIHKIKKKIPLPLPRPFSLSHFRRVHSFKCVREGETKRRTTSGKGAGIAQWLLERRTREWKVAGSNPCRSGGRIFNKRHVIMQTSVTSLCKQDKRHVIMLTRQASRHYPNKTSFTSLSKQAPEPLYWHTPPDWYSRYEHVHQYKLFTVCTRVNRCCTIADSFTRLLPTQCRVENGLALPHTLFLLATVKDRNRLAWCDFYFDFISAHPWEKSRLYWWNANNNYYYYVNIIIIIIIITTTIATTKQ